MRVSRRVFRTHIVCDSATCNPMGSKLPRTISYIIIILTQTNYHKEGPIFFFFFYNQRNTIKGSEGFIINTSRAASTSIVFIKIIITHNRFNDQY